MIACHCGRQHDDASTMTKVGWYTLEDGDGGFGLLANCPCLATMTVRTVQNAALCAICRRLVTGEAGVDPRVHELVGSRARVLCSGCARRTGVGLHLVALSFRTWVKTGNRKALIDWRREWRRVNPPPPVAVGAY
jgi:hypothetical protein